MVNNFKSNGASNFNGNIASRYSNSQSRARCSWLHCWVVVLCCVTCISLTAAYFSVVQSCDYAGGNYGSSSCRMRVTVPQNGNPRLQSRLFSDDEITSRAVAKDVLWHHSTDRPAGSKIAFMFMTPGPLPLESVWVDFWAGHEGLYTVYVHSSEGNDYKRFGWKSPVFIAGAIPSRKVFWGRIEMVDAERRLMAHALLDPANMFFVLLSDSCIPLYDFNYIYAFLIGADKSFVESFDDPGMHGRGRYLTHMKPEIEETDWRKGPQWIAIHRAHAMLVVLDRVYYKKFKMFCKPGVVENFNCVADEHYIPTLLHIMDAEGLANRSLTYADWSNGGWHPQAYGKDDITPMLLMKMQSVTTYTHVTSEEPQRVIREPCLWNGETHACYLFSRKFLSDSAQVLRQIIPTLSETTYSR